MKRVLLIGLVTVSFLSGLACNPRQVDDGTYNSGTNSGAIENTMATDRAETTVAVTDTAALILPADTAAVKSKKHL